MATSMTKNAKPALLSEHQEQSILVEWFRLQYPQYAIRLFAIPNGGLRNVMVARKLQKEGVLPGVADLFLMIASGGYHGLFIEMKRRNGGKQSGAQKEFEAECSIAGFAYRLCNGFYEAKDAILSYLDAGSGQ